MRGREVEETAQSKRGHQFWGPAGEGDRNLGRVKLNGVNEADRRTEIGVNVADRVMQTLLSVAEMNDQTNHVVINFLDHYEGSKVIRVDSPEDRAVRAAVAKSNGIPIRRVKNTFLIRLWLDVVVKDKNMTKDFTRQAK